MQLKPENHDVVHLFTNHSFSAVATGSNYSITEATLLITLLRPILGHVCFALFSASMSIFQLAVRVQFQHCKMSNC